MKVIGALSALVVLAAAIQISSAQDSLAVNAQDLMAHVDTRVPLVYPPIAQAARVTGTVVVQIEVSPEGKVTATKVLSGPPMLLQAALDCVKHWTFKPFERDGVAVTASGPVSLVFTLGESVAGSGPRSDPPPGSTQTVVVMAEGVAPDAAEDATAQRYFQQWNDCTRGTLAGKRDQETVSACKSAADTAAEFAPDRRFIEKRASNVYAATALANAGDLAGALAYADKAVAVVKLGHDDASGSNAAYSTRGTIEAMMGNLSAADADLTVSEDFERKGVAWTEQEKVTSLGPSYRRVLARDLRVHAKVLEQLGRPAEALAKVDEAAKL